jgi:hypothetical protein
MSRKKLWIVSEGGRLLEDKKISWKCELCGDAFGWMESGYNSFVALCNLTLDHGPYVVTLVDGKPHDVCSHECARTLGMVIGIREIVRTIRPG